MTPCRADPVPVVTSIGWKGRQEQIDQRRVDLITGPRWLKAEHGVDRMLQAASSGIFSRGIE